MINDDVLQGRMPRLGSITLGRGTEAESQKGVTYSKPTRADTLVFHTNDPEVATAAQTALGGDVLQESPHWTYDVVTDARQADVRLLPAGFRQALELWRAAECLRRCDGVRMSHEDGRPTDKPCACADEMSRGHDRACGPSTILPCFVDLPVERFGVWEVRSSSWGTAAALKGTMRVIAMAGGRVDEVPAVLQMVDRQVRDADGRLRDVVELHATVAVSHRGLSALAAGDEPPALDSGRQALMDRWAELRGRAVALGVRDALASEWAASFSASSFEELTVDQLATWVGVAQRVVLRAEAAHGAESPSEAEAPPPGGEAPEAAPEPHGGGDPSGGEGS